jgi:hypothetical protein
MKLVFGMGEIQKRHLTACTSLFDIHPRDVHRTGLFRLRQAHACHHLETSSLTGFGKRPAAHWPFSRMPDASSFFDESDQPHTDFSRITGRFPYSVRRRKEMYQVHPRHFPETDTFI